MACSRSVIKKNGGAADVRCSTILHGYADIERLPLKFPHHGSFQDTNWTLCSFIPITDAFKTEFPLYLLDLPVTFLKYPLSHAQDDHPNAP